MNIIQFTRDFPDEAACRDHNINNKKVDNKRFNF